MPYRSVKVGRVTYQWDINNDSIRVVLQQLGYSNVTFDQKRGDNFIPTGTGTSWVYFPNSLAVTVHALSLYLAARKLVSLLQALLY